MTKTPPLSTLLNWLGGALALAALVWFAGQILEHRQTFAAIDTNALLPFAGALALQTLGVLLFGVGWHQWLKAVGVRSTAASAVAICGISQIAKYIPGNVAHHVGRVVLARRYGFGTAATVFSMFIETVWLIAIAGLVALAALLLADAYVFRRVPHLPQTWIHVGLVVLALGAPIVGHRVFHWGARWWTKRHDLSEVTVPMPALSTFWLVGLLYAGIYVLSGLVLHLIATRIFAAPETGVLILSGIFAVAWIAGFVTPGAPAGLGVRDVVLVAALTPLYGPEVAVGTAAIVRLVNILGDGLALAVALAIGRLQRPQEVHG